ncbi:outer membrane beta-barrel protein [Elizabethkingia ursingii]|uniref:outer membrane beta-barrel protein n=1 Tax=Elizabethkingia ursingii TaxID=1756150 RepID=UPI00201365F8|nr:outer membrane beta-barrel protein [Elizabethkingia ursingii]MCL1672684.1 porin family protein [Elizabethkingia ursingii]
MKKSLLLGAFALLGFAASAQTTGQLKIGANIGIPVGDISNTTSFTMGLDAAYQWRLAENFDLGIATGYHHYFTKSKFKDAGGKDYGFIPIAASAQYSIDPKFFIGADLGYGISTNSDMTKGGFYYQPKVGYQQPDWELYLGYKGISVDGGNVGSVNLGFNFKFR